MAEDDSWHRSTVARAGGEKLNRGDSFTFQARDPKDKDYVGRTYTVMRTEQDYAQDLCDAYNASRSADSPFENYVDKLGNIRLRKRDERHDTTREWVPEPGEIERLQARIANLRERGMTQEQFNRLVDEGKMR